MPEAALAVIVFLAWVAAGIFAWATFAVLGLRMEPVGPALEAAPPIRARSRPTAHVWP